MISKARSVRLANIALAKLHKVEVEKRQAAKAGEIVASIAVSPSGLGERLTELTGMSLDHMAQVLTTADKNGPKSRHGQKQQASKNDVAKAVLRAQVMSDQTAFMERRSALLSDVVAALLGADGQENVIEGDKAVDGNSEL